MELQNNVWLEAEAKIIWLIGQQCAGKTMLARVLESCGADVLNIGEELRSKIQWRKFLDTENPYAPNFVEEQVQDMIRGAIHNLKRTGGTLIIDSAPRNQLQLPMLADVSEMSIVLFVLEDYEIRRARAKFKYGSDLSLFEKREAFEVQWIREFAGLCLEHSLDHIVLRGKKS